MLTLKPGNSAIESSLKRALEWIEADLRFEIVAKGRLLKRDTNDFGGGPAGDGLKNGHTYRNGTVNRCTEPTRMRAKSPDSRPPDNGPLRSGLAMALIGTPGRETPRGSDNESSATHDAPEWSGVLGPRW
jgi:hypothetical protein